MKGVRRVGKRCRYRLARYADRHTESHPFAPTATGSALLQSSTGRWSERDWVQLNVEYWTLNTRYCMHKLYEVGDQYSIILATWLMHTKIVPVLFNKVISDERLCCRLCCVPGTRKGVPFAVQAWVLDVCGGGW